ncbi:enoyl-CoA hydratase/isomerase family protein [Rhodococcus koreensis]|uniref:enoyl-CoA hydratase/isomerase family protein n=1 Tax=Rhodococcus koreensis TaxID=99653 RepID=UPI0019809A2E|nr:enoyl-CoA hydratase/isomerase family protein [Rhodococcus koreensis]QSE86198.1 enoyl-CoA hydratase/isomerase family protein [Rhodococcus koreensis]
MSEVRFGRCGYTLTHERTTVQPEQSTIVPDDADEIRFHHQGPVARIVLNRPKALNALTTSMITQLHRALDEWEENPGTAVVLESSSPKAFCAGGDIRQIRQNTVAGAYGDSDDFFASEYRLNARIAELTTPLVSLIDGVCMGGGMGLSVHGAFRVVSDKAVLAMPETAIGFFPDVGGSYFLSRLPGALGMYLGLTGYRLDAADAVYTGLATHRVTDVALVVSALEENPQTPIDEVLRSLPPAAPTTTSRLAEHRCEIDWCFGAPNVSEIHSRLRDHHSSWSRDTLAVLDSASPQSLEVTFAVLTAGKQRNLLRCLKMELDVATHLARTPDFVEGVRAGLADKDRSPVWGESLFGGFDAGGSSVWHRLP